MDQIHIDELRGEAVIGVYDWERELRQQLLLTIALAFDSGAVARAGSLDGGHDYAQICEALREWAAGWDGELLEVFAEDACRLLRERFGARAIALRVDKPLAAQKLGCARVGVSVQRSYA